MGNSYSSNNNQTGGNITELQSKVEKFIQKLMNEKGNDINNKKYCDTIEIVLKDNILSGLKKTELININEQYGIGYKVNDGQTKADICQKLTEYYMKKIEITLTIKNLLEMLSNKINNISFMNRCVADKTAVSKIKYATSKSWQKLPSELLKSINISELRTSMFEGTGLDPSAYYYVIELDNKQECEYNGGRWLSGIERLEKEGIIPPKDVTKYNQKYRQIKDQIQNSQAQTIVKLSELFSRLCKEEQQNVDKGNGKTERVNLYNELPISMTELNNIEQSVVNLITNDIIGVERLYLSLVSLDIVTKQEILAFQEQEENLKKLQSNINSRESEFQKSN